MKNRINPDLKDLIKLQFSLTQGNPNVLRILSGSDTLPLLRQFREMLLSALKELLPEWDPLQREFYQGGFAAVFAWWVRSGMNEPPEMIAERVVRLMEGRI
jgi:hypothetical protein